jgi:uncharacterized protein (TIGR03437 family)
VVSRPLFSPLALVICLLVLSGTAGSLLGQITLNPAPSRVLGQDSTTIKNLNPNLVEGREFDLPEGLALDTSTNPPALYVCDTVNNRVLGFRHASGFTNGQTADLVLGQPDLATTLTPAQGNVTGTVLVQPTGIVVDTQGNVYVVDSGDNRILRFPKPFAQTGGQTADLVIGQASFTTNGANLGGISAATLNLTSTSGPLVSYPAFDATGNLWVGDAGNNRILRFNATALAAAPPVMGPAADLVLGQTDFVTGTYNPPTASSPFLSLTAIDSPTGIAFDTSGRLFVDESVAKRQGRILLWTSPFYIGEPASRILGIDASNPPPPAVSEFQLNVGPGNLFAFGNGIAVTDTFNNRILVFPPVEQWTPGTTYQAATEVAGQPDFSSGSPNAGGSTAGPNGFALPGAAAFSGGMLYVPDSFNNRVILMPQNGNTFGPATMVLGQDQLNLNAPNLTEGREFNFGSNGTGYDAGIAVDLATATPHLYVADTFNNRILGFNDLRSVQTGAKADLVIGQPDFQQTLINYPSNSASQPNASGLSVPTGLAVDSQGNLWVADTGNSRVLRFPAPFANYKSGTPEQADLVLGQASFSGATITDATDRTMAAPYGLAFTLAGGLLVSDAALNRVLYFAGQPADFTSGMSAGMVFGQPDFNSSRPGNGLNQMSAPRGIASDTDDRLYVADTGNGRIDLYNNVPTASAGQPTALTLSSDLVRPVGVYVSAITGEIWVADAGAAEAIRFPSFLNLNPDNNSPDGGFTNLAGPLALTEDAWGDLLVADEAHRVGIHYPEMSPENAANYLDPQVLAPGMIAAMFTLGTSTQFGTTGASATSLPLPTTLNGVQVLFNGAPVPLFYAGPNQINFQVPVGAPQTGTVEMQVIQPATGRILGDTIVGMTAALPGFFTAGATGSGDALALNEDNTVNSADNPAAQGTVIQLFGTGQGFLQGAPPDGSAATGLTQTATLPVIIMGAGPVAPANIQYSGLAPSEVGVWQVNVLIPDSVISLPNFPTQVIAIINNVPSGGAGLMRGVYIHVKQ